MKTAQLLKAAALYAYNTNFTTFQSDMGIKGSYARELFNLAPYDLGAFIARLDTDNLKRFSEVIEHYASANESQ